MKIGQKWFKKDKTRQLIILNYFGDDLWEVEIEILSEFYKGLMDEIAPFNIDDEEYVIIVNETGQIIYDQYDLID